MNLERRNRGGVEGLSQRLGRFLTRTKKRAVSDRICCDSGGSTSEVIFGVVVVVVIGLMATGTIEPGQGNGESSWVCRVSPLCHAARPTVTYPQQEGDPSWYQRQRIGFNTRVGFAGAFVSGLILGDAGGERGSTEESKLQCAGQTVSSVLILGDVRDAGVALAQRRDDRLHAAVASLVPAYGDVYRYRQDVRVPIGETLDQIAVFEDEHVDRHRERLDTTQRNTGE